MLKVKNPETEHKLKISREIIKQQKFNVPYVFSEIVKAYKKYFPNNKVRYAILNSDLTTSTDFILITEFYNPIVKQNMFNILITPRFCNTSTSGFNYIMKFGEAFYEDYFNDLGTLSIIMFKHNFENYLAAIPVTQTSKYLLEDELTPLGIPTGRKHPKELHGLSMNKGDENYFYTPKNVNIFIHNLDTLKQMYDDRLSQEFDYKKLNKEYKTNFNTDSDENIASFKKSLAKIKK